MDKTYTIDELRAILRVSRGTIKRLINSGKLAAFKVGQQYRVTNEAYQKFIKGE